MDKATLFGIVFCGGMVFWAMVMGHGGLPLFIDVHALVIVFGGSVGAIFIAYPLKEVIGVLNVVKKTFLVKEEAFSELVATIVDMTEKARREGVLALQGMIEKLDDEFLKSGVTLVVDGVDPHDVEKILQSDIDQIAERHKIGAEMFATWGAFGPAYGMIGTLIGLVVMFSNMSDPGSIGPAMALCLVATFYGAAMANMICIPVGTKLKGRSKHEQIRKQLILTGILALQAGDNPRIVEQRLNTFIKSKDRKSRFKD